MPRYDVFLSHNDADTAAVEAIASRLRDEAGLRPFLRNQDLLPGELWIPALARAIDNSATVAIFFGPQGKSAWQDQEEQLALVHAVQHDARRVIPVFLPSAREQDIEGFLRLRSRVDLAADDGFSRLVAGITGRTPELRMGFDPHPALSRRLNLRTRHHRERIDFTSERGRHTHFFGREKIFIELDAWLEHHDRGWLLITAGPGRGKSALLDRWLRRREAAGLLTAFHFIRRGHANWADPLALQANLAAQIEHHFPDQRDTDATIRTRLDQLLQRVSPVLADRAQHLVLLVDGLDEAMEPNADSPIPSMFPLELPPRVFVVAASRPRGPGLDWFDLRTGPSHRIDLEERTTSNNHAVREFWRALGPTLTPPLTDTILHAAIDAAQGNLLHAVKLHQRWTDPTITRSPTAIPRGFDAMLQEFWRRVGLLPEHDESRVREGLSLLCAARESLPLPVMDALLAWDEGDAEETFLPFAREVLLEKPTASAPAYRPFHESLRELVQRKRPQATSTHREALTAYAAWPLDGDTFQQRYALRHRITHLVELGQLEAADQTVMDLDYLAHKARTQGLAAVEHDIRLVVKTHPSSEARARLALLQRVVTASAHWARDAPDALPSLMHDRALTHAPALHRHLFSTPHPRVVGPRLRHPLQVRGLSTILRGHDDDVSAIAILLPHTVISGSHDGTLRVWDAADGRLQRVLQSPRGPIHAVAALPDGRLASGGHDGSLTLWDPSSGRLLATSDIHDDTVEAIAALPDGRIASGAHDCTIRLWDPSTDRPPRILRGHLRPVTAIVVLPDHRLVSASHDGSIRIWDPSSSTTPSIVLHGHTGPVNTLATLPDGQVASASEDRTIRLWNLATGHTVATLDAHDDGVTALVPLPENRIASASKDATVRIWDVRDHRPLATLRGHQDAVCTLAALADGRVVSGSSDSTLRIWDPTDSNSPPTLDTHCDWVTALAVSPDGQIVSGSNDHTIRIWDPRSGRSTAVLRGHTKEVVALAMLPEGRLLSGAHDGTIRRWDLTTGQLVDTVDAHEDALTTLAVLPEGRIASCAHDQTLRIWDATSLRPLGLLDGPGDGVSALAIRADGLIISGSFDHCIHVWTLETGHSVELRGHEGWVRALAILPDGRLLSGSADGTVRLWDLDTNREVVRVHGHSSEVTAVAVLPGGRLLSASHDGTLQIWTPALDRALASVYGDAAFASAVVVDAGLLAAGDTAGNVWFIDLP